MIFVLTEVKLHEARSFVRIRSTNLQLIIVTNWTRTTNMEYKNGYYLLWENIQYSYYLCVRATQDHRAVDIGCIHMNTESQSKSHNAFRASQLPTNQYRTVVSILHAKYLTEYCGWRERARVKWNSIFGKW